MAAMAMPPGTAMAAAPNSVLLPGEGAPASQPSAAAADPTVLRYAVRLNHLYDVPNGATVLRHAVPSLGTITGSNAILTHNHFHTPTGRLDNEAMRFDAPGQPTARVPMGDLAHTRLNDQTTQFTLGGEWRPTAAPAPIAEAATLAALWPGDVVTVVYWDDAAQSLAVTACAIAAASPGVLTLADPDNLFNGGDSGGGVFYQGALVGNTWGFLTDQTGARLGLVNVALVNAGK
jgi:hypothetical protein